MILLVDIGNSRIKWRALHAEANTMCSEVYAGAQIEEWLASHWMTVKVPSAVLISNVAGNSMQDVITDWCRRQWQLQPDFIFAEAERHGVRNGYIDPAQLGSDRWVSLLAAHAIAPEGAIVVDCGTAITIDMLTADGVFEGGMIIPGLELCRRVLNSGTREIASKTTVDEDVVASLLGRSTRACVNAGALLAVRAAVNAAIHAIHQQGVDKSAFTIVLTGGGAKTVVVENAGKTVFIPDLVLRGLSLYAEALI